MRQHESSRVSWRAVTALAAVLATVGAASAILARSALPSPPFTALDGTPPRDARYTAALQQGLAGDLAGARANFTALATATTGSSIAAHALYQAALAAKAQGDLAGAAAFFTQLRTSYPSHPLALRLKPSPAAPPPRPRRLADCGPRSLLALCEEAGIPAKLPELTLQCETGEDGTSMAALAKAAEKQGMRAVGVQCDRWFLAKHRPAGLALWEQDHFVAFRPTATREGAGARGSRGEGERAADTLEVFDPADGQWRAVPLDRLVDRSQGVMLLIAWGERDLPPVE